MSFQCHSDLSSYDFIKHNETLHSSPESCESTQIDQGLL